MTTKRKYVTAVREPKAKKTCVGLGAEEEEIKTPTWKELHAKILVNQQPKVTYDEYYKAYDREIKQDIALAMENEENESETPMDVLPQKIENRRQDLDARQRAWKDVVDSLMASALGTRARSEDDSIFVSLLDD